MQTRQPRSDIRFTQPLGGAVQTTGGGMNHCARNTMLMFRSEVAHLLDVHLRQRGASGQRLFDMALHEVTDPSDGSISGYEAAVVFRMAQHPASFWFDTARRFGMLGELELRVVEAALHLLATIPTDLRLVISASPQTVLDPQFTRLVLRHAPRLTLRLVPNGRAPSPDALADALVPLLSRGMQVTAATESAGQTPRLPPEAMGFVRGRVPHTTGGLALGALSR